MYKYYPTREVPVSHCPSSGQSGDECEPPVGGLAARPGSLNTDHLQPHLLSRGGEPRPGAPPRVHQLQVREHCQPQVS